MTTEVRISCTEAPQFVRLVELLGELCEYISTADDPDQRVVEIYQDCSNDLLRLGGADADEPCGHVAHFWNEDEECDRPKGHPGPHGVVGAGLRWNDKGDQVE